MKLVAFVIQITIMSVAPILAFMGVPMNLYIDVNTLTEAHLRFSVLITFMLAILTLASFCIMALSLVWSSILMVILSVAIGANSQLFLLESVFRFIISFAMGEPAMRYMPTELRTSTK